jgi:hypothetical protein
MAATPKTVAITIDFTENFFSSFMIVAEIKS